MALCGCDAGGSTHSLPTSLALERPPSILLSRVGIGRREHWVMTPFPASLVTVSRLRSVNRHTLCRLSLLPSVANGIVCRCKRPCWHTYQQRHHSTIDCPFLSTINNPAILARGGQCIGTKKSPPNRGAVLLGLGLRGGRFAASALGLVYCIGGGLRLC